jgi:pyruvate formate lyase activating enzyme
LIAWSDVLAWLRRRRGLLDAVVFSGGEPTLQRALLQAVGEVRALGFKVGLHTAGCYPERLRRLLPWVDWVGLDIKALPEQYPSLTGVPGSGVPSWRSLRYLLAANRDHEVRVTVHSELLTAAELARLIGRLRLTGVRRLVLQRCRSASTLDASLGPNVAACPAVERVLAKQY